MPHGFFNPFVTTISMVISLINFGLMLWIILGLLIHFDIVNRFNPLVNRIYTSLTRLFEPLLQPIRRRLQRWLPDLGGVDLSPLVLLILMHFIDSALHDWFYAI